MGARHYPLLGVISKPRPLGVDLYSEINESSTY
jgi:hypothetical protein